MMWVNSHGRLGLKKSGFVISLLVCFWFGLVFFFLSLELYGYQFEWKRRQPGDKLLSQVKESID